MLVVRICLVGLMVAGMSSVCQIHAQDVPPMSEDQQQALEQISERVNTATLSFLASDSLKGRGTGTEGLQVAGAYVASRFEAAGLEGPEGSFFQHHEIDSIQNPDQGINLASSGGDALPHLGVLHAGTAEYQFTGNATTDDAETLTGAVILDGQAVGSSRRDLMQFGRQVRSMQERGATSVLLKVPGDHELVALAAMRSTQPRMARRGPEFPVPVLLVPETFESQEIRLVIPAMLTGKMDVANVIGILEGSDPGLSDQCVIFSAHLDHLGEIENGTDDKIYNGADDNASGVTGVLALADAYASLESRPARTVMFIAYWGEESGLLGSRHLMENPVWPLDQVVANVNLEMIGRPEAGASGKAWMTGWEHSDLGRLMNAGSQRIGFDIFEHPEFSNRLYRASDNWPLAQAGIIAHSFSAGSLHNDYHQPSDEWEKLDLRHLTIVCKGLFAGSLPIADGQITPTAKEE